MSDTDLHQPDLGLLRAATEAAELAQATSGLVRTYGCAFGDGDLIAQLVGIARSLAEAWLLTGRGGLQPGEGR